MEDGSNDYVLLLSLATREEAEVVAAAFRADGVDAFVERTNHLGMEWFYALALGGVRIFAPRSQAVESKQLIRERIEENANAFADERVAPRDRWKIWLLIAWLYGLPWLLMLIGSWSWPEDEKHHPLEWIGGVTRAPVLQR